MLDRIMLILKTKNLSSSQLADKIGVQRSSISHVLSGRNKPSLDFIMKILGTFPEISYEWMLTGKGEMYKNEPIVERDLFTGISDKSDLTAPQTNDVKEKYDNEEDIINEKSGSDDVKINQLKEGKHQEIINEIHKEEKKKINNEIKSRDFVEIEKVIIFYSDKSFVEYIPSGKKN